MVEQVPLPTYETLLTEAIRNLAADSGIVTTPVLPGGNTLTDQSKGWASGIHRNRLVKIIKGIGSGQQAVIGGNSGNTLWIRGGWPGSIGIGATYAIVGLDTMQALRDVFGGGSDISPTNPLEVHDPKVGSLISYEGTTDADGAPGGTTLVCSDLTTHPDYDGNLVIITSGDYAGQARDITGVTTGGTVTPHTAFGGQIVSGTKFVIAALRLTPAEVAAIAADIGDASASVLGSLYAILGNPSTSLTSKINHVPKFTGNLWWVSPAGNDANDGKSPEQAFLTPPHAISEAAAGDRIYVKAGTYNGAINLNKAGLELICEQGTVFSNTTPGTVLVANANYCRVVGAIASQAGETGFQITGSFCSFDDCLAFACDVGFDDDGAETHLENCRSILHTATGFDISAGYGLYDRCIAAGGGVAVTGVLLSDAAADHNGFHDCHTLGNTTRGWDVMAGADNNLFSGCSTGAGDVAKRDLGTNNTWDDFSEGSQIVDGQSRDQDLADIHALVDTAEAVGPFTYLNVGGEQDVYEDTATTRRKISIELDLNTMTQDGTIRVKRKVDGTNYRTWIEHSFSAAGAEKVWTVSEAVTNQAFKVTYEEAVDETADRDIEYNVITQVIE